MEVKRLFKASKPLEPSEMMRENAGNRVNMCVINLSQLLAVSVGKIAKHMGIISLLASCAVKVHICPCVTTRRWAQSTVPIVSKSA